MEGDNAKLNQYTTFDQWGLDYDLNGNMSQKGVQRFYYDYRNQLVRVVEGTTNTHLKYDALGRRIEKSTGSNTVKYYYDGNQVIEERDGSDEVKRQFIYGNGIDELLIIFNYDGATAIPYYVHTNDIGSTTAITNQDGNIVERVSYDTFGMPTFTDYLTDPQNPTVVANSVIGNDILFQGRRYDRETNLLYFRARYYDPIMGRFLSVDPIGYKDSMNLYQAFNNNPVNFVDPMGKTLYIGGDKVRVMGWLMDILGGEGYLNNQEYIQNVYIPGSMKYDFERDSEYISPLVGMDEITFNVKPTVDINVNAGAWLINELINSKKVFVLGAGDFCPTFADLNTRIGRESGVGTVVNIDWESDTRIDRYSPGGKTSRSLPPLTIDSVVWFGNDLINNIAMGEVMYGFEPHLPASRNQNIPFTQSDFYFLVFHELLESFMEVDYGFQYLDRDCYFSINGQRVGSHYFSILIEVQYLRRQRNLNQRVTGGALRRVR